MPVNYNKVHAARGVVRLTKLQIQAMALVAKEKALKPKYVVITPLKGYPHLHMTWVATHSRYVADKYALALKNKKQIKTTHAFGFRTINARSYSYKLPAPMDAFYSNARMGPHIEVLDKNLRLKQVIPVSKQNVTLDLTKVRVKKI
jgi:hypothetical protein